MFNDFDFSPISPTPLNAPSVEAVADVLFAKELVKTYHMAKAKRHHWESHWRECYAYALPQREGAAVDAGIISPRNMEELFDGTAPDAVDQLAASMLANLTPPWSGWFALGVGTDVDALEARRLAPILEQASKVLRLHMEASNFAVEMHQCFLDLATVGTACLAFEEGQTGANSAFRFTAVPLNSVVLEDGAGGRLEGTYSAIQIK